MYSLMGWIESLRPVKEGLVTRLLTPLAANNMGGYLNLGR